ncbi:MAG: tetratricopeptide repeat protein [Spirochaetaceae bacterium]|jgi:tetratricopeptide (TPR) repeat protein|nr:tetratricopeptide repeat protein [Spirochaetaceae bacterium]
MGGRKFFALMICAALLSLPGFSQETRPDALRSYRIGRDLEARDRLQDARPYYDEAIRICLEEIDRNAVNMDSYTVLTWALQRQNRYAEVIEWGQRGLRVNTNDFRIIETMGEASFYLNQYAQSLRYMQRYVDGNPQGERISVAFFFIGEIYRLQQKYRHADIAYTTAVRLEPGLALWWYRLGTVRESAGEYPNAVEAYERALLLNPNYREASEGLVRSRR